MAPTHVLTPSTFTKATGPKVQSSTRSKSPFGGDWQASQGEMERKIKEQEEQVSSLTQFHSDFLHSYSRELVKLTQVWPLTQFFSVSFL